MSFIVKGERWVGSREVLLQRSATIILTVVYCKLPCGTYVSPSYEDLERNLERDLAAHARGS